MTMDYTNVGNVVAFVTTGAIRQNRLVKISGNHTIAECDAEEQAIGVSRQAASASGDTIEVQIAGIGKLQAGGVVTAGNYVNADADGKGIAEATDKKVLSGIAMNAAVDGDYFSILIINAVHSV